MDYCKQKIKAGEVGSSMPLAGIVIQHHELEETVAIAAQPQRPVRFAGNQQFVPRQSQGHGQAFGFAAQLSFCAIADRQ